jgi:hypothetical protein
MAMPWNPAFQIIEKLGGEPAVASATGTSYTAPYRWQHGTDKGGTGGKIPAKHIPTLLEYAKENGVELSASDFFAEPAFVETTKERAA